MKQVRHTPLRKKAVKAGYRSGFEMRFHELFPTMKFEPEKFPYTVEEERKYTPDFVDEEGTWYELKGRFTAPDRKKMLRIRRQYPFQRIVFVFQAPSNKLTKAPNSQAYFEWAENNGFEWTTIERMKKNEEA